MAAVNEGMTYVPSLTRSACAADGSHLRQGFKRRRKTGQATRSSMTSLT